VRVRDATVTVEGVSAPVADASSAVVVAVVVEAVVVALIKVYYIRYGRARTTTPAASP